MMVFKASQFTALHKFLSSETVEPVGEHSQMYFQRKARSVPTKSDLISIAPHDRILDLHEEMGLKFGFNPVKEHSLGASRVDAVWLKREKGETKVGIEVELSGQITIDLWKLYKLQP